jgi:hypothetical protein
VYQLAVHNKRTLARIEELYARSGEGSHALDYNGTLAIFKKLLEVPETVYIIVDALDECTQ